MPKEEQGGTRFKASDVVVGAVEVMELYSVDEKLEREAMDRMGWSEEFAQGAEFMEERQQESTRHPRRALASWALGSSRGTAAKPSTRGGFLSEVSERHEAFCGDAKPSPVGADVSRHRVDILECAARVCSSARLRVCSSARCRACRRKVGVMTDASAAKAVAEKRSMPERMKHMDSRFLRMQQLIQARGDV